MASMGGGIRPWLGAAWLSISHRGRWRCRRRTTVGLLRMSRPVDHKQTQFAEAMQSWPWDRVVARRLRRSHLLGQKQDAPVDVVRSVCGVQAQVPTAAELSVGVRTDRLTRAGLRKVVNEERALIRTYAMRNTAHLVPTDDLPLYMAAMRQLYGGEGRWFNAFGLDSGRADELFAAIREALDHRRLTRRELAAALRGRLGGWIFERFDPLLAQLSVVAAYAGALAYGPNIGGRSTFVRPDQWGRGSAWEEVEGETALNELICRFFTAYGPASHRDLARWLGVKSGQARRLVGALRDHLVEVEFGGQPAWLPANDLYRDKKTARGVVRLLPEYDCYILGSGPPGQVAPPAATDLVRRRKRGRYEGAAGVPVVLIDGVVAGVWEWRQVGSRMHITVEPIRPLTPAERLELERAAELVAAFDEAVAETRVL